jgi:hypothetical protein
VKLDDPKEAKKVYTYKWLRRRMENYIAREDQDAIEHDWDKKVSRITGHSNPAAAGIGYMTQFRSPSRAKSTGSIRTRSNSGNYGTRREPRQNGIERNHQRSQAQLIERQRLR